MNKRTMRPMTNDSFAIPYGAIVDLVKEDGDQWQFLYLGEPYESKAETVLLTQSLRHSIEPDRSKNSAPTAPRIPGMKQAYAELDV